MAHFRVYFTAFLTFALSAYVTYYYIRTPNYEPFSADNHIEQSINPSFEVRETKRLHSCWNGAEQFDKYVTKSLENVLTPYSGWKGWVADSFHYNYGLHFPKRKRWYCFGYVFIIVNDRRVDSVVDKEGERDRQVDIQVWSPAGRGSSRETGRETGRQVGGKVETR